MLQTFGFHPQSQLQAQKCLHRVGLEAHLLALEHHLIKRYFQGRVKGDNFIFWLTPTLPLKALKSVHRLDLEAHVLTLEHIFVNSYCWVQCKDTFLFYDFWAPTRTSSLRHKRCPQAQTGPSTIDYRVSFDKQVLLGMTLGDILCY